MSRRKQTNPRAIKRDGKGVVFPLFQIEFFSLVSADEDDNSNPIAKSKKSFEMNSYLCFVLFDYRDGN